MHYDTLLVNTPVSSPLHPQLNLPLLKSYLKNHNYEVKIFDTSIDFFCEFLEHRDFRQEMRECLDQPIKFLEFYNKLEALLYEKSKGWEGLSVGLRTLNMKYDRIYFNTVIESLEDRKANPFIDFYERFVEEKVRPASPKIVGIAITFQDQIISAFTLADQLRKKMPEVKIVMGGQMITRCHESIMENSEITRFMDFLVLWDGEMPFLDIHEKVIRGKEVNLVNAVDLSCNAHTIRRLEKALSTQDIPSPDFSDLDLGKYLLSEMMLPFQTTRGCYAACAFCAIPFGSNKYRQRDAAHIVDDFVRIQKETRDRYGVELSFFKFMEDTSSPKVLLDLSLEVEKRGMNIKWETFARFEKKFAEPGFLQQLYRGGCRKIHWGLESNDPAVLQSMNKKTEMSYADTVLRLAAEAGILNFCFVLAGFPGETDEQRKMLVDYINGNPNIHTITMTTFDLTLKSPMELSFQPENEYQLDRVKAKDFQVRLPYTVDGENWKEKIIPIAHQMMIDIVKGRPDIGFMTLFPDQIRAYLCDKYGNNWARIFLEQYGTQNVKDMLLNAEKYADAYSNQQEIDPGALPDPIRREHFRTKEDLRMIANAVGLRRKYETRRFDQV